MEQIYNLFKATRVERTIHIAAIMLIPVAFTNSLNINVAILALCCVLLYSGFSIHNAIQDKDFTLPRYAKTVFISMIVASIIISSYNKIIFFTVLAWIILGYIYNTVSRKFLFADISVLCATNFGIPVISSALVLGLDTRFAVLLSIFVYVIYWFILNIKNMVGFADDKKRGYKTIGTEFQDNSKLLKSYYVASFILIFCSQFIFKMYESFLFCSIILFVLVYFVFNCIDAKEWKLCLKITRSIMLFITVSFLFGKGADIATPLLFFFFLHCGFWIFELLNIVKLYPVSNKQNAEIQLN